MHAEVTDDGRPFNPLSYEPPPAPKDLQSAKIGGLGIRMMRGFADQIAYERSGPINRLAVVPDHLNTGAACSPSVRNLSEIPQSRASHSWSIGWFSISAWNRTIIMIRNNGLMNAARTVAASSAAMKTVTMPPTRAPRRQHDRDGRCRRQQTSHTTKLSKRSRMTIHTEVFRIGLAFWQ